MSIGWAYALLGQDLIRIAEKIHEVRIEIDETPAYSGLIGILNEQIEAQQAQYTDWAICKRVSTGSAAFATRLEGATFAWATVKHISDWIVDTPDVGPLRRLALETLAGRSAQRSNPAPVVLADGMKILIHDYLTHLTSYLNREVARVEEQNDTAGGATSGSGPARRNAQSRERLLGGALAVLAAYPERCRSEKGSRAGQVTAAAIYRELVDCSNLLYGDAGMPLQDDAGLRAIRGWLKKVKNGAAEGGQ